MSSQTDLKKAFKCLNCYCFFVFLNNNQIDKVKGYQKIQKIYNLQRLTRIIHMISMSYDSNKCMNLFI